MSEHDEILKELEETKHLLELEKLMTQALVLQNRDFQHSEQMHKMYYEEAQEAALAEDKEWVCLWDTNDEDFGKLVKSEAARRFPDHKSYAKDLAEELSSAQYKVTNFMEELAKAEVWFSENT